MIMKNSRRRKINSSVLANNRSSRRICARQLDAITFQQSIHSKQTATPRDFQPPSPFLSPSGVHAGGEGEEGRLRPCNNN
jgi:hypothetical protein